MSIERMRYYNDPRPSQSGRHTSSETVRDTIMGIGAGAGADYGGVVSQKKIWSQVCVGANWHSMRHAFVVAGSALARVGWRVVVDVCSDVWACRGCVG